MGVEETLDLLDLLDCQETQEHLEILANQDQLDQLDNRDSLVKMFYYLCTIFTLSRGNFFEVDLFLAASLYNQ